MQNYLWCQLTAFFFHSYRKRGCRLYSRTCPLWSPFRLAVKLNLFLMTLQPVVIPDDASTGTLFSDHFPAHSWNSFRQLTTFLPTKSSSGHMNTVYKTVLIKASAIESPILRLPSLVPVVRQPCPACLHNNHRSSPETTLTCLSTQQPSFQSRDNRDLPIYTTIIVLVFWQPWLACLPNNHRSSPVTTLTCLSPQQPSF